MEKLTKRREEIINFIRKSGGAQNREVLAHLKKVLEPVSRITVARELDALIQIGLLIKEGRGRNIRYKEKVDNKLLAFINPESYYKEGPDERSVAYERFNFNVFKEIGNFFSQAEIKELEKLNSGYEQRIKKMTPAQIKKEFERLTIELSWKSSRIEGNTYSLIDTEILIKEHKEAMGHKKEEAIMILNHKKALDYIFAQKKDFRRITLRKIESIHRLLMAGLGVGFGLRKRSVGIAGTKFKPLDNEHEIREAMEKFVSAVNKIKNPLDKTLAAILFISYIQPFEDGNKRTSRLLGNAILMAHNVCPLSYRSINEADYKKAVILFYEQNSARFMKELFVEQYKFSVENYF
jgi:fido (protein-threonine AMPylation protein)